MLKRSSSQRATSILDHGPLDSEAEDCEADEPSVIAEVLEYIEFAIAKFTGVNLVE